MNLFALGRSRYIWSSLVLLPRVFCFATSKVPPTNRRPKNTHPRAASRTFLSSSMSDPSSKKMDQSFGTWRLNTPCERMEWSPLANVNLEPSTTKNVAQLLSDNGDDMVVLGVFAPPKEAEEEQDKDEQDNDKDPPVLELTGVAKEIDTTLQGALSSLLEETIKTYKNGAKVGSTTPILRTVQPSKKYSLLGLGPENEHVPSGMELGESLANLFKDEPKLSSASVYLPSSVASNATIIQDLTTSFYQTLHSDNRYRTKSKRKEPAKELKSVTIVSDVAVDATAIATGKHIAAGVVLSKDIVNAPHNVLNSLSLADTARRLAEQSDNLECQILDGAQCQALGMGAYLGVARGSETPPQFIVLTYTPPSDVKSTVGVVGKGLLFDTGGYNIKTRMMELMKFDCGGSAAVLGAAHTIGQLRPPNVKVHFVVAACENMINEKAYVPSDILTAMNGKTIEVLNTDAEGRLTLADALVYADKELGCEKIIELSTLTGACMVALGKGICGLWTANDDLAAELQAASKTTGDKSWRMPLPKEYNEQLESKIADIKNIGGPYGGSITAALFLQNFVDSKKPFAHIDIAGPIWSDKIGATGFGAKLVVDWVLQQGKE